MWFVIALLIAGVVIWVAVYLRNQDGDASPPDEQPEPVVAGPEDLARADALLGRFELAVGDSDALYEAFAAISRAGGGIGTYEEHIRRGGLNTVEERLPRPWYWLAAVAAEAERAGDHHLAACVCLFTEMFVITFLPRMDLAGSMDAGLDRPPGRARARIALVGLDAAAHLPADQVVAGNQTGATRVRDVRLMCAHALTELDQGEADVPGEVLARAHRIIETGDDAPHQAADILADVTALVASGKLAEALDRSARHLVACRQARGPEDPATIQATAALGFAQLRAGKVYDVVATLEPAYALAVRVLGEGDFPTLQIAANLAAALRNTERADRALPLLEDALAACQRTLSPDDAIALAIRSELAATHTMLGNHPQAVDMHQQLLADRTRVLGPHHADTLTSADFLGEAHRAAGDLDRAISQYESVVAASREALGAEYPDTLNSQHSLAGVYAEGDRVDEAIALYEATLAARRRVLGASHLDTLNTMNSLAVAYTRAHRLKQALALLEEAAAGCAESLAPDNPIAKNIEASLLVARMMAIPPPATTHTAPAPPAKREGPRLQQVASFTSPGNDSGIGHAWSPSGHRLAVAGFDNSVCVFDPASGQLVWQTHRHGTVISVSWSPDGQTLASGTSQRTVHLFAADTGEELRHATGHDDEIRSIAYATDGRLVATAGNDGRLCVWGATDLRVVATIAAHTGRARSAAWAPDSTSLASCGQDNAVRVWRAGAWSLTGALTDHTAEVSSVAFSPDRRFLASGSLDGTVRVWDLVAQRYHHVLDADRWWVVDLAFSPDSGLLAALSNEEVLVFDLGTGEPVATALAPIGTQSISWQPGGRHLATVGFNAIIWAFPPELATSR